MDEGASEEQRRTRHALIQLIRFSEGEKTFARRDFSEEAFRCLADLERDGIIEEVPGEEVPGGDDSAHTYRLKKKYP